MENEVLYSTKFIELRAHKRIGGTKWVYAHRPNAKDIAVIVPVIKNNTQESVLFLITKRPPIFSENRGQYCLEFPAGLVGDIDKNEDILCAVSRELKEESGYEAEKIKIVSRNIASSAGLTSETSTIAIAYIDGKKAFEEPSDDDGGVIIGRKLVKKEDILDFVKDFEAQGNTIGAQTLSGLYFYFFDN